MTPYVARPMGRTSPSANRTSWPACGRDQHFGRFPGDGGDPDELVSLLEQDRLDPVGADVLELVERRPLHEPLAGREEEPPPSAARSWIGRSVWTRSPDFSFGRRLMTAFPFDCRLPSGSSYAFSW